MIILTTQEPVIIQFIPRDNNISELVFVDEQTREETTYDKTGYTKTVLSNSLEVSIPKNTVVLKEGRTYIFKVLDTNQKVLYYDMIYCTDKDISDNAPFLRSTDDTIQHSTENKYKIYE